jgi:peptidoglycan hydrolase-like protein with peptidoglycan-binding domain
VPKTGIERIDNLLANTRAALPVGPGDPDRDAVGLIQDLLIGFGNKSLPDVRQPSHGAYGQTTRNAVRQFRSDHGLDNADTVDANCLRALATGGPADPMACIGYIALTLESELSAMTHLMTLTALWEANARFARLNRNTDRAGLSFGLIQWAQKPKRLHGLIQAFRDADTGRFESMFGGAEDAAGLLAHAAKANGGVDPATGRTIDPAFDLVTDPWAGRFLQAGADPVFQRVQVALATADLQRTWDAMKDHTSAIRSQRGVGFLMDVANQHGRGGATSIYDTVFTPALTEAALLKAMRDESVRRVTQQFGEGSNEARATADRRDWFLETVVLSDGPFGD